MTTMHYLGRITRVRLSRSYALLLLCAIALPAQTLDSLGRKYRERPTPAARATLQQFAAAHPKDENGALALFAMGVAEWEHKLPAEALKHLNAAETRLPALGDYIAYYKAAALFDQENYAEVVRVAPTAWQQPRIASNVAARAVLLAAKAHLKLGAGTAAVQLLRNLPTNLPQPQAQLTLGAALEAAGDPLGAAAAYQRVYYDYPSSSESSEADDALQRLQKTLGEKYPPPMPQAMFTRADKLLTAREYTKARKEYEQIAAETGGAQRDLARVLTGVCSYRLKPNHAALSYFKTLSVSATEADAERLFYVMSAARKLNDDDAANEALEELARKHPHSRWRMDALIATANSYLVTNRSDRYLPLYRACHDTFSPDPAAFMCHWRVTWNAYLQRRPEAGDLLREHLLIYPASEQANAALYYLGRLQEDRNDLAGAKGYYVEVATRYPNSYYAMVARQRLSDSRIAAAAAKTPELLTNIAFPVRKSTENFEPDAQLKVRVERSRMLSSIGFDDLSESELRFGARNGEQPVLIAMELARRAYQRGAPDQGIRYIKGIAPSYFWLDINAAPVTFWQYAYPLPYRSSIEKWSRQHELDPFLVAGLVRQESEFNAGVVSHANAYGLTQVVPRTGRSLARSAGIKTFRTNMLFQPDINLNLGTKYIRDLLNQHGGNIEQTLASYNAGKSRTDLWRTWGNFREQAEFVETIPFSETRNYVQSVLRNADFYRRLYEGRKAEVISMDGPIAARSISAPAKPAPKPAAKRKPAPRKKVRK